MNPELIYVKTNLNGIFFDAFLSMTHESDLTVTTHPVQQGASVADHAYMEPLRLTMTVKMSECNSDIWPEQFTGRYSRPASALAVLQALQASRVPFRVHTRLRAYDNMLIRRVTAPDAAGTLYGMEATVVMQEVLVARAETVKVTKRRQTVMETQGGVLSVQAVTDDHTRLLADAL